MTKDDVLMMADVLSKEKDIDRGIVFEAIEAALATATRKRNREDIEVRVEIDRKTGDYKAFRQWEIMEDDAAVESPARQTTLAAAEITHPESAHELGGVVEEPLETVATFGRIEAQAAKQ
ncbi:MAG: NusA N-terminal domain-containing protein, partial [Gammaproteobacteria bacterium]